jgi:hypothetical protein
MHERHDMIMGDEIRERAEQLLRCINAVSPESPIAALT